MSTLSLRKIKHDSSAVDNITLDSNGQVGILATPTAPLTIGRVSTNNEGGQIDFCRSTDNASSWGIDVYGNTSTPSLRIIDNVAAAVRMQIDGSGRVTMPYQPIFKAGANATISTSGTGQAIAFQNTGDRYACNVGNHYSTSTGRFTAPISGKYIFYAQLLGQSLGGGDNTEIYLDVNGSLAAIGGRMSYQNEYTGEGGYMMMTVTSTFALSVNDYVSVSWYRQGSSGTIHGNTAWSYFTGYLVA